MQATRATTFRAFPNAEQARQLGRIAGACGFVWNQSLKDNAYAYAGWKIGANKKPSTAYFSLSSELKTMKQRFPWLAELPYVVVRQSLKRLSLATLTTMMD